MLVVVAAAVVIVVVDPFGGAGKSSGGVVDNAYPTSSVSITRQSLSSQTQVSGTLGYRGSSNVLVPSGTAPSAVQQAQQSVTTSEGMLRKARASLSGDGEKLAEAQASASAAREKEAVDCAGDGAAESASGGSSACATAAQAVATAQQGVTSATSKLTSDRESVTSAQSALAGAEGSLSAARSSAVFYGQGSVFTSLPAVGQVLARGQTIYEAGGQRVVLMYGSLLATRAFVAGISPGRDVAELNANLEALGYGQGLGGDTFSASTAAAIRAFQSAHGLSVTGGLPLGSVVFEPGPVRVTSVTPQVGSTVQAGPVLALSSTARQVTIELEAAEQSYIKLGDPVTITLPDNQTTPGRVSYVASVAKAGSSSSSSSTIQVEVTPTDPAATGRLDEAPVEVSITTASVESALVVPVDALLALSGGGYAVEVVGPGGAHRLGDG